MTYVPLKITHPELDRFCGILCILNIASSACPLLKQALDGSWFQFLKSISICEV